MISVSEKVKEGGILLQCCISQHVFNGIFDFIVDFGCGCVFSLKSYKLVSDKGENEEVKEGEKGRCINCGKETNKHFVKIGKANENTEQNTITSNVVG